MDPIQTSCCVSKCRILHQIPCAEHFFLMIDHFLESYKIPTPLHVSSSLWLTMVYFPSLIASYAVDPLQISCNPTREGEVPSASRVDKATGSKSKGAPPRFHDPAESLSCRLGVLDCHSQAFLGSSSTWENWTLSSDAKPQMLIQWPFLLGT